MNPVQTIAEVDRDVGPPKVNSEDAGDASTKASLIDLVASKLDGKWDKFTRLHFEEWKNGLKSASSRANDVIHTVASIASLDALADCIAKDIEAQAAISRYKLAKRKMITVVDEFEDSLNPEAEWEAEIIQDPESGHIDVLLLKSEETVTQEAFAKLFVSIKAIINADASELDKILIDEFPESFDEIFDCMEGMKQFVKDVAEFLLENGDEGRKIANDVCHRLDVAKQVAQDQEKPKPLVFLAQIAAKELE